MAIAFNQTSFATDKKASSCGSLLSTVIKFDPEKNQASFEEFHFLNEEFCDQGTNEVNANFELQLFDKSQKLFNQKNIFLNTIEIHENMNPKSPNDFKSHKFIKKPQYRVVKFSLEVPGDQVATYKIIFKKDKKVLGSGPVTGVSNEKK